MEYRDFVVKRIPPHVKNKDRFTFGFLLSIVTQNAIRTTEQLNNHISAEIDLCRRWLAKNRASSTMNKLRRETVQKLQNLVKIKNLLDAHLK